MLSLLNQKQHQKMKARKNIIFTIKKFWTYQMTMSLSLKIYRKISHNLKLLKIKNRQFKKIQTRLKQLCQKKIQ